MVRPERIEISRHSVSASAWLSALGDELFLHRLLGVSSCIESRRPWSLAASRSSFLAARSSSLQDEIRLLNVRVLPCWRQVVQRVLRCCLQCTFV